MPGEIAEGFIGKFFEHKNPAGIPERNSIHTQTGIPGSIQPGISGGSPREIIGKILSGILLVKFLGKSRKETSNEYSKKLLETQKEFFDKNLRKFHRNEQSECQQE